MQRWLLVGIATLLLGCQMPLTQIDAQATAAASGCWPGNVATPRAITVTPSGAQTATPSATSTTLGGTPTATRWPTSTALPTTTPYPRCTPGPNDPTLIPYPTAVPAKPPYPTKEPTLRQGGSDQQTVFLLPGKSYQIDLAVHPTEGWPVVAVTQRDTLSTDPIQSFVRVFNPQANRWSVAQQVDLGESSNGTDRNGSTVVGVTGDRTVVAVWGASDKTATYEGGIWTSRSTDFGTSWSQPQRIADNCSLVQDMATTASGWIVVLATCFARSSAGAQLFAGMLVREPDGTWQPIARLRSVPATYGAVVIVGDGEQARAVALTTAHPSVGDPRQLYLFTKTLGAGSWITTTRPFRVTGIDSANLGTFGVNVQGIAYTRPNGQQGVTFVWAGRDQASIYSLTSLDGGQRWDDVMPIVYRQSGETLAFVSPAYDAAADRLVALWLCCGEQQSTHYTSWSAPGARWQPRYDASSATPLVFGSRAGASSVAAQAPNARVAWFAWVEQANQVSVRTLNLNQVIPVDQYPPTPTRGAQ